MISQICISTSFVIQKYFTGIVYELFSLKLVCNYIKSEMLTVIVFDAQFYIDLSSLLFLTLS